MNKEKKDRAWRIMDAAVTVIVVVILVIAVWMLLDAVAEAQWCRLEWRKYFSYWWQRWISIPMWCCGYRCVPACQNYYGGWGPCY